MVNSISKHRDRESISYQRTSEFIPGSMLTYAKFHFKIISKTENVKRIIKEKIIYLLFGYK